MKRGIKNAQKSRNLLKKRIRPPAGYSTQRTDTDISQIAFQISFQPKNQRAAMVSFAVLFIIYFADFIEAHVILGHHRLHSGLRQHNRL